MIDTEPTGRPDDLGGPDDTDRPDDTGRSDDQPVWRAGSDRLAAIDRRDEHTGHELYGPEDTEMVARPAPSDPTT